MKEFSSTNTNAVVKTNSHQQQTTSKQGQLSSSSSSHRHRQLAATPIANNERKCATALKKTNRSTENSSNNNSSQNKQPRTHPRTGKSTCYNTRGRSNSNSKINRSSSNSTNSNNKLSSKQSSSKQSSSKNTSRRRLPFMSSDNVDQANQSNSQPNLNESNKSEETKTDRPNSSSLNHQSNTHVHRIVEQRPATPFSLRKQIALALELSRDPIQSQTNNSTATSSSNEQTSYPSSATNSPPPPLVTDETVNQTNNCTTTSTGNLKKIRSYSIESRSGSASNSPNTIQTTSVTPSSSKKLHRKNNKGETELHLAAIRGDFYRLEQLFKQYEDSDLSNAVDVTDNAGWTPLHEACNRGHSQAVRVLIQHGANVNASAECGTTPLIDAARNGHLSIVRVLLRHGAIPTIADRRGQTAFDVAGNANIEQLLRNYNFTQDGDSNDNEDVVKKLEEDSELPLPNTTTNTTSTITATTSNNTTLGITSLSELKSVIHYICINDSNDNSSDSKKLVQEQRQHNPNSHYKENEFGKHSKHTKVSSQSTQLEEVVDSEKKLSMSVNSTTTISSLITNSNKSTLSSLSSTLMSAEATSTNAFTNPSSTSFITINTTPAVSATVSTLSASNSPSSSSLSTTLATLSGQTNNQSLSSVSTSSSSLKLISAYSQSSSLEGSSTTCSTIPNLSVSSTSSNEIKSHLNNSTTQLSKTSVITSSNNSPVAQQIPLGQFSVGSVFSPLLSHKRPRIEGDCEPTVTSSVTTLTSSSSTPVITATTPIIVVPKKLTRDNEPSSSTTSSHEQSGHLEEKPHTSSMSTEATTSVTITSTPSSSTITSTINSSLPSVGNLNCQPQEPSSSTQNGSEHGSSSISSSSSSSSGSSQFVISSSIGPLSSSASTTMKVPPLRIVLSTGSNVLYHGTSSSPSSSSTSSVVLNTAATTQLSLATNTVSSGHLNSSITSSTTLTQSNALNQPLDAKYPYVVSTTTSPSDDNSESVNENIDGITHNTSNTNSSATTLTHRITRSSQRVALQQQKHHSSDNEEQTMGLITGSIGAQSGGPNSVGSSGTIENSDGTVSGSNLTTNSIKPTREIGTRKKKNRGAAARAAAAAERAAAAAAQSSTSGNCGPFSTINLPSGTQTHLNVVSSATTSGTSTNDTGGGGGNDDNSNSSSNAGSSMNNGSNNVPNNGNGGNNNNNNNNGNSGNNNGNGNGSNGSNGGGLIGVDPYTSASLNVYSYKAEKSSHQMFMKIRDIIKKRRTSMTQTLPKPPATFPEFLMNRSDYVLQTNVHQFDECKPELPPAPLIPGSALYALFIDQEKVRNRMRVQHRVEQEKMRLTAEQECYRLHCRAAAAQSGQMLPPLSACTFLKDEEQYNLMDLEASERDPSTDNVIIAQIKTDNPNFLNHGPSGMNGIGRIRFNGRLFISWQSDLLDKWSKLKNQLLSRQRLEAETLSSSQRYIWDWKVQELAEQSGGTPGTAGIYHHHYPHPKFHTNGFLEDKDTFVPMIKVVDDFPLLPPEKKNAHIQHVF